MLKPSVWAIDVCAQPCYIDCILRHIPDVERTLWKTHSVLVSFSAFETKEVEWLRRFADMQ